MFLFIKISVTFVANSSLWPQQRYTVSAGGKLAQADRGKRAQAEEHEDREPRRCANRLEAEDEPMERRVQRTDAIRAKRQHEAEQGNRHHRQYGRPAVASPPEPRASDRQHD